jgi:hypothetical protein
MSLSTIGTLKFFTAGKTVSCPACRGETDCYKDIGSVVKFPRLSLCGYCGHIFTKESERIARNMTPTEKSYLRENQANSGVAEMRRQQELITGKYWG